MVDIKSSINPLQTGNSTALAKTMGEVVNIVSGYTHTAAEEPKKTEKSNSALLDLPKDASSDDFLTALMVIQNKLNEQKQLATRGDIKEAKRRNEAEHKKNLEKMQESQEKAKEVEKSGLAQKIFGWITTTISVIVAAVVTVATLGAGAGIGAMIAVGVALATTLVSTAIQAANEVQVDVGGTKMGAFSAVIYKAALNNMNKEEAGKAASYSIMAIQLALAIIGMVASFGASGVGKLSEIAKVGAEMGAKVGAKIGNAVGQGLQQGLKQTTIALNVVSGMATVGSSASGIGTTVINKEAQDIQAERLDIKANLKEMEAEQQKMQEKLKQMMEEMQSIFQTIMQIMSGNADTAKSIIKRTTI